MIYVLEVYNYKSNKKHQLMFSENSIKLNKFIDLIIEYHTDWIFCSRTFREFCVDRCSNDWLDYFESLFFTLSINLSKECDWWNELVVSEIETYKVEWTAKIKEITTGTKAEFTSWATSMHAIGNQAIKGLIEGMKGMTGPLQAQAKAIADAVSKTIKSVLKIKSPSRVMMDEVGKWIPLGLAEGISKHIDAVVSAANRMAQATIPSANSLTLNSAARPIVNNTTNAPITINLTYNGTGSQQDAYNIVDIIERELGSRMNTRLRMSGVRV